MFDGIFEGAAEVMGMSERDRLEQFGDVPFHLSVDLDSTICDTRHRKGIIEKYTSAGLPIDWDEYSKACIKDKPLPLVYLLQQIQYAIPWHVTSGRSEGARDGTMRWLHKYGLKPKTVNLEDSSDSHKALGHVEWKVQRILGLATIYPIRLHIDDWSGIGDALEERSAGKVKGMTVTPPGMIATAVENVLH